MEPPFFLVSIYIYIYTRYIYIYRYMYRSIAQFRHRGSPNFARVAWAIRRPQRIRWNPKEPGLKNHRGAHQEFKIEICALPRRRCTCQILLATKKSPKVKQGDKIGLQDCTTLHGSHRISQNEFSCYSLILKSGNLASSWPVQHNGSCVLADLKEKVQTQLVRSLASDCANSVLVPHGFNQKGTADPEYLRISRTNSMFFRKYHESSCLSLKWLSPLMWSWGSLAKSQMCFTILKLWTRQLW